MGSTYYKELFKLYDLIQCAELRYIERYLEENKLELNSILPCKGIGVLHLAVGIDPLEKSKDCTKLILNHGGDPNLCNDDGVTPVHIAAIWGRLDNLKMLIGCGGDPFKHDFDGYSCFDYAAREQQWEVYDYLHNVIDEKEDSTGPERAYTLDLERVLVSTEQMVAEYEPVPVEEEARKSDMIREWCENNSLVINKLYPTILSETFDVETGFDERKDWRFDETKNSCRSDERSCRFDESKDCRFGETKNSCRSDGRSCRFDESKDSRFDESKNSCRSDGRKNSCRFDESKNSCRFDERSKERVVNKLYPTLLNEAIDLETSRFDERKESFRHDDRSKSSRERSKSNETSTIEDRIECSRLDDTFKTCTSRREVEITGIQPLEITSDQSQRRFTVYENFSLPGSPTCITHKNYNTKTSLKKSKSRNDDLISELKYKLSLRESIMTDDTQDLDKALIVAQNKTNEWLSLSGEDNRACNTRRSSASSGVSSNFSGSIVLANIEEEYKYKDKEEDVVLIEKRIRVTPVVLPVDDRDSPDQTIASIASSLPASMDYDNNALRAELVALGFNPGPILDSTRSLYLKKLHALKKNPIVVKEQGKTYSVELQKSLRSSDWMHDLAHFMELETKAKADFACPNKKWREGSAKTSFTYLLLDPRMTDNLPAKSSKQSPLESWTTFVNSIFYVGKGKRSRPYSHLYQALTLWKQNFTKSNDKKVQHILDIWSNKVGVLVLHVFQNVIPAEAYTHEAAMIDVLGLQNLKNLKTGNYYGVVASWPLKERKMFGLYLLYRAMNIFFSEGERQLRPEDID
ncbi:uncharacterized protein LOC121737353 [Aricia agestis]|uniref:uncharacterized protein LOC121737353 n=1 Tax=Aricia agestis TaxID=91739 RepID=UPI001C20A5D1|nr:uncharacterized protein LOC121737353 [Aricia agestis]